MAYTAYTSYVYTYKLYMHTYKLYETAAERVACTCACHEEKELSE